MGSKGSNRFSDYPGGQGGSSPKGGAGGGGQGGGSADDRCRAAFTTILEDVEHSPYFARTGGAPAVGTKLTVQHQKRIVAVTQSGEVVGNLPTRLNYLAECLADGFAYDGEVTAVAPGATLVVATSFTAA